MRYLGWFLTLVAAVIAADFAVSNRHAVDIGFWPLPDTLSLPTFMVVLGAVFFGLLFGRISLWPKHQRLKSAHKRHLRRLETLEAEQALSKDSPTGTMPAAKPPSRSLAA